jgi:hypothetical protein
LGLEVVAQASAGRQMKQKHQHPDPHQRAQGIGDPRRIPWVGQGIEPVP